MHVTSVVRLRITPHTTPMALMFDRLNGLIIADNHIFDLTVLSSFDVHTSDSMHQETHAYTVIGPSLPIPTFSQQCTCQYTYTPLGHAMFYQLLTTPHVYQDEHT